MKKNYSSFSKTFKDKKVLVTGHTGFKGSWLLVWLKMLGAKTCGISNESLGPNSMFESLSLKDDILDLTLDVTHYEDLKKNISDFKPDFIFHLAAQAIVKRSFFNPLETIRTNVMGPMNLLNSLKELEKKPITVIITSDKVYKNNEWLWGYRENDILGGKDIYSGSKAASELLIESYLQTFSQEDLGRIAVGRAGNVIGGGDWAENRIVPDTIKSWYKNKPVKIRMPKATRPWQHVLEPISGYLTLAEKLSKNANLHSECFNFGPNTSEPGISVEYLLNFLAEKWRLEIDPFISENEDDYLESGLLKLNCDKATELLQWRPALSFEESCELIVEWYKRFKENPKEMENFTKNQILYYIENG